MNTKLLIGAGAAVLLLLTVVATHTAFSNARIRRLESSVEKSSAAADEAARIAATREREAAIYKEKIEYLETTVGEIRDRAAKQDEQLEKATASARGARVDYDRARRTRSVPANTAQLCEKLSALGHPC